MRAARGSSLQAGRGEREAQDPRKLEDGILKRVLKSSGMERESVGNRFRLLLSAAEAGAGARARLLEPRDLAAESRPLCALRRNESPGTSCASWGAGLGRDTGVNSHLAQTREFKTTASMS